ncbi:MAG: hypothetical protein R6V72_03085 [Cyclobacterium sp.]|uniref:hypothetical protein n=1 Tax=unclassified Cyclobacterium TaxID=2615055 RepID=UPI0013D7575F|nr:hypothetical protein [Cyclobacterium sp. SYSU L10401]
MDTKRRRDGETWGEGNLRTIAWRGEVGVFCHREYGGDTKGAEEFLEKDGTCMAAKKTLSDLCASFAFSVAKSFVSKGKIKVPGYKFTQDYLYLKPG